MNERLVKSTLVGVGVALFFSSRDARASGASAALLAGHAFSDAYKFGVGVRGGFTLPANVYFGGTVMAHVGKVGRQVGMFSSPQTDYWYFGAEAGYELSYTLLTFRPYLGAGYALVRESFPPNCQGPCEASTRGRVALVPGATVLVNFSPFFAGADARYYAWLGDDYANALGVFGALGMTF